MNKRSERAKAHVRQKGAFWQSVTLGIRRFYEHKTPSLKYRLCRRAAFRICLIGFENDEVAQDHLSKAKDALYSAAIRFDHLRKRS